MTPRRIQEETIERSYSALSALDPELSRLVDQFGHPEPFPWRDGGRTGTSRFAAMVLHILGQHVATITGYLLYDRIASTVGGIPTADDLLALSHERLHECGVPIQKATYLHDLARAQSSGALDLEGMTRLTDSEATAAMTAVRGIGLWSAEMFLIHQLRRPDVLPATDAGLRRATRELYRLDNTPTADELRHRAATWSPYRTYAAALLWRSLPHDPKAEALRRLPPPTYL